MVLDMVLVFGLSLGYRTIDNQKKYKTWSFVWWFGNDQVPKYHTKYHDHGWYGTNTIGNVLSP
jgi:hypothetical protein